MCDLLGTNVIFVNKPWGWEKWIASGEEFPYVMKQICLRASHKTSVQVHKFKRETNLVIKGRGLAYLSRAPIDVDRFLEGGYTKSQLDQIINLMELKSIEAGCIFHVLPGFIHQMIATVDLQIIEVSTPEVDDVFRLRDSAGRGHGRIESEHVEDFQDGM